MRHRFCGMLHSRWTVSRPPNAYRHLDPDRHPDRLRNAHSHSHLDCGCDRNRIAFTHADGNRGQHRHGDSDADRYAHHDRHRYVDDDPDRYAHDDRDQHVDDDPNRYAHDDRDQHVDGDPDRYVHHNRDQYVHDDCLTVCDWHSHRQHHALREPHANAEHHPEPEPDDWGPTELAARRRRDPHPREGVRAAYRLHVLSPAPRSAALARLGRLGGAILHASGTHPADPPGAAWRPGAKPTGLRERVSRRNLPAGQSVGDPYQPHASTEPCRRNVRHPH